MHYIYNEETYKLFVLIVSVRTRTLVNFNVVAEETTWLTVERIHKKGCNENFKTEKTHDEEYRRLLRRDIKERTLLYITIIITVLCEGTDITMV